MEALQQNLYSDKSYTDRAQRFVVFETVREVSVADFGECYS